MSTSLSKRTLVLLWYEPCANTSMLRFESASLLRIASRIMRSAFSAFSASWSLDGDAQLRNNVSQSRAITAPAIGRGSDSNDESENPVQIILYPDATVRKPRPPRGGDV